jgi:serine/threonine protein phosphatase PrpC
MRTPLPILIILAFLANVLGPLPTYAEGVLLPQPGVRVALSGSFQPPVLNGIKVHPDNPFKFDFIMDKGDSHLSDEALKMESSKLIKYFLASLTVPEKDLWVNLSPYEQERIVPESFGQTEMGRDLLAQDYLLKQVAASLIYPEDEVGKKFWQRVYQEASAKFNNTKMPVNTFNKVWIVPQKAVIFENTKNHTAYIVESKLKVMLDEDYLSKDKHKATQDDTTHVGNQIVREIVLPELEKEINDGENFAKLRQVYHSLILAAWYKKKIKESLINKVYADKNKVDGVKIDDPNEKERIYEQYIQAFKKGVYNYIKEDEDPVTHQIIPRKYFSGGFHLAMTSVDAGQILEVTHDGAMLSALFSKLKRLMSSFEVNAEITPSQSQPTSATETAISSIKPSVNYPVGAEIDTLYDTIGRYNQDAVWSDKSGSIGIADGVGGAIDGDVASMITKVIIRERLGRLQNGINGLSSAEEVKEYMKETVQQIIQKMDSVNSWKLKPVHVSSQMATTLSWAVIWKNKLIAINVGDSRIYVKKSKTSEVLQASQDDDLSRVKKYPQDYEGQEEIKVSLERGDPLGIIVDAIKGSKLRRGFLPHQIIELDVEPGDFIITASDGITDNLKDMQIKEISDNHTDPIALSKALIEAAKKKPVKIDDLSVAVLQVPDAAMFHMGEEEGELLQEIENAKMLIRIDELSAAKSILLRVVDSLDPDIRARANVFLNNIEHLASLDEKERAKALPVFSADSTAEDVLTILFNQKDRTNFSVLDASNMTRKMVPDEFAILSQKLLEKSKASDYVSDGLKIRRKMRAYFLLVSKAHDNESIVEMAGQALKDLGVDPKAERIKTILRDGVEKSITQAVDLYDSKSASQVILDLASALTGRDVLDTELAVEDLMDEYKDQSKDVRYIYTIFLVLFRLIDTQESYNWEESVSSLLLRYAENASDEPTEQRLFNNISLFGQNVMGYVVTDKVEARLSPFFDAAMLEEESLGKLLKWVQPQSERTPSLDLVAALEALALAGKSADKLNKVLATMQNFDDFELQYSRGTQPAEGINLALGQLVLFLKKKGYPDGGKIITPSRVQMAKYNVAVYLAALEKNKSLIWKMDDQIIIGNFQPVNWNAQYAALIASITALENPMEFSPSLRGKAQMILRDIAEKDEGSLKPLAEIWLRAFDPIENQTVSQIVGVNQKIDAHMHILRLIARGYHFGLMELDETTVASKVSQRVKEGESSVVYAATLLEYFLSGRSNKAMTATEREGGIDFKSDRMDVLDVQNEGEGIKFNLSPAQLKQFENVPGFTPVIINIQPVKDLPLFLGLEKPAASAS